MAHRGAEDDARADAGGDRAAFARLFDWWSRAVFLDLVARVRTREDAEDALRSVNGRDLGLFGGIEAESRVPFRHVASVLAVLRDRGLERVEFYGAPLPTDEERRAGTLPYPRGGEADEPDGR